MTAPREIYETVAVTALAPGWRNVYRKDDGELTDEDPCPAVLLRELRGTETGPEHLFEPFDPPYRTEAVAATMGDGWLSPACESGNYVCTIGPGVTLAALAADLERTP